MAYLRTAVLLFWFFCQTACKHKEITAAQVPAFLQETVVFCFHDIGRRGRYAIPLEDFRAILNELKDYRVISLADWVHARNTDDTRRRIVLTFDDGYGAHRDLVVPELKARGFGATFFFYADQLSKDKKWISIAANNAEKLDFGSHSWSHALIRNMPYHEIFRELYLARNFMADTLKHKIESFAWPYGYYDADGLLAAQNAGFAYQVSVDYRIATRRDIAKIIPRYTIYGLNPVKQVRQVLAVFQKTGQAG